MSLAKLKKKIEDQKGGKAVPDSPIQNSGVAPTRKNTPANIRRVPTPEVVYVENPLDKVTINVALASPSVPKSIVANSPIPMGYTALGKHEVDKLMWLKDQIIQAGICSFDYETDGDPDDDTTDPQDHKMVTVSVAYKIGMAVMLPIAHVGYGANWDKNWLVENFLKPILEHPDVYVIAHNIKFETQVSLLAGIDMFPKTETKKIMDTMLMVKALALPENTQQVGEKYEVIVGLKPATKALLATPDGMVHGLLHIDEIKSFKDTVGRHEWEEPTGEFYKSGANKGLPKMKKMSRSRTFDELPITKETIDYSCSDSDWALGIFYKLLPMLEAEGIMDTLYELDVPFMMTLGEYELAGWHISREKLEGLGGVANTALHGIEDDKEYTEVELQEAEKLRSKYTPNEERWAGLEHLLYDALLELTSEVTDTDEEGNVLVPAGAYGMGQWRGDDTLLLIKTTKPFSWGSVPHKQWLFYHVLKMDTRGIERSKTTGLPGTDAKTMAKLIETYSGDNQFMRILKEKSKYDKINSTYVNGMLPYCRQDTRKIHTNMNLVSTWRLSSKKPNLQNIPRADNDPLGIRGVFVAPKYDPQADYSHLNPFTKPVSIITEQKLSGLTFYIGSDYAQIELKVLAWFAGEQGMIDILANGGDLHSWVAVQVFKLACAVEEVKELYKPLRYQSKAVNFGLVYGLTEFGLSKDPKMNMNKDQAKQFIEDYMAKFPGVREYAKEMISFGRQNGYVETMFKHRRPVPHINHPNQFVRQKAENICMNTPIQGSASDIIRLAMVNMKKEAPPWFKGVMQIHDECQGEVPIEYGVEGARFMKSVMEREIEGFTDIMPIVSEPAIGATWDTALDIKWDDKGTPYVKPKKEKKEATDVTYDMIAPYENYYKIAGITIK